MRCRQCGDMVQGTVEAIERHSAQCKQENTAHLARCKKCGLGVEGDMEAIERHSALCAGPPADDENTADSAGPAEALE